MYANLSGNEFDEHIDGLFILVHKTTFNKSAQGLALLDQISQKKPELRARFFRALYAKMNEPEFCTSSKQSFLLNVIFKALKSTLSHLP